jgi:hypothetical protein
VERIRRVTVLAALPLLAAGLTGMAPPPTSGTVPGKGVDIEISALSSRPDMVTGGDALVRVDAPRGIPPGQLTVRVNGLDVSDDFVAEPDDRSLTGLVTGLEDGPNRVTAGVAGSREFVELTLVNHPITGPLFSGPHQEPFICDTNSFELVVDPGPGPGGLIPSADAYVRAGSFADDNFGDDDMLIKIASPNTTREIFMTFDLTEADLEIGEGERATLFMYSRTTGATVPIDIRQVIDPDWDENTVTWNTRPVPDDHVWASFARTSDGWHDVDITDLVEHAVAEGVEELGLAMQASAVTDPAARFASKESPGLEPRLVIGPPPTGGTLGPPLDENCSVETRVDYMYRTTGGAFIALPSGTTRPADLAWTTTSTGAEVPYIVRVETGTINRGIYEIAMLHDPEAGGADPWNRPDGWNERLIYKFGGGCSSGYYVQGRATDGVADHGMLQQGYAVASSSLNVFGNNCNDLLASETMAMVKERFIEAYGPPAFTLGWGSSGGSYQSHQISDNYPGLLDGILVNSSFPDVGFATTPTVTDAGLLNRYFNQVVPGRFSAEQQRQISGFGSVGSLTLPITRINPSSGCKSWLPVAQRYHPVNNPEGARCDLFSATKNVYGVDAETGLPKRPLDNVGVQYGLAALEDGVITVDEFLDLNEAIGGYDIDANFVPERTVADLDATAAAYRSGRLLNGGGGLGDVPIVDVRRYYDERPAGDVHHRFHGFSTRERLLKANGTFDNQVMLVSAAGGFNSADWLVRPALAELDAWVTAILDDTDPAAAPIEKIRRNKPGWLEDSCWVNGDQERVIEPQLPDITGSACADAFPVWPSPRMVAGGPLASDIVKCELTPFDTGDYAAEFTAEQRARAENDVFPDGVCDWSQPGIEQQGLAGTWQRF